MGNNANTKTKQILINKKLLAFFLAAAFVGFFAGIFLNQLIFPTGLITLDSSHLSHSGLAEELSLEEVQEKAKEFLETSQMLFFHTASLRQVGHTLEVTDAVKENEYFYRFDFDLFEGNRKQDEFTAFVSRDGTFLIFGEKISLGNAILIAGELFVIDEPIVYSVPPSPLPVAELQCENMQKTDDPELLAFIYTGCGFGLQMQRIFSHLPPTLLENIEVKYISDAREDLRQVCIREEKPEKYWDYAACYLKEGDFESCLEEIGLDTELLKECVDSRSDNYISEDRELAEAFGVEGSPTLVLNGEILNETLSAVSLGKNIRSSAHIQKLLCCSFETEPLACNENVPEGEAVTGFSETYSLDGFS